jgi:hypothetical protein
MGSLKNKTQGLFKSSGPIFAPDQLKVIAISIDYSNDYKNKKNDFINNLLIAALLISTFFRLMNKL